LGVVGPTAVAGNFIAPGAVGNVPLLGGGTAAGALNGAAGAFVPVREPQTRYGYALQAGVKVNLPMIAPGDVFWLQAAYSHGAMSYTGAPRLNGYEALSDPTSGKFQINTDDAVVFANGKVKLTDAASVTAAFLHYWTPQWRQAFFGSYATVQFPNGSRGPFGPLATLQGVVASGVGATVVSPVIAAVGTVAAQNALAFNATLRDYDHIVVGSNLIYSPVKDLDIGLEVLYNRVTLRQGSVADANKFAANGVGGAVAATAGGGTVTANVAGLPPGIPLRTTNFDDVLLARFRVQRDF
jgi:hypothetical protein